MPHLICKKQYLQFYLFPWEKFFAILVLILQYVFSLQDIMVELNAFQRHLYDKQI